MYLAYNLSVNLNTVFKFIFTKICKIKTAENGEKIVECEFGEKEVRIGKLFLQAIATSIDALAVGVTLQMAALSPQGLALGVWGATAVIGITTVILAVGAVYIGKFIGDKLTDKAELFGGLVLLAIGVKILIESLI